MKRKTNINVSSLSLYESIKPYGADELTPRKGYYLLLKVKAEAIPDHLNRQPIAYAMWKYHPEEDFNKDVIVAVNLAAFASNASSKNEDALNSIYDYIIHVRASWIEQEHETKKIKCYWSALQLKNHPLKENLEQSIDTTSNSLQAESDEELAIILKDMEEQLDDWDNYEANLHLDIEEAKDGYSTDNA